MADPRAIVAYDGVHAVYSPAQIDGVTITYDKTQPFGSAQAGLAVTLSANGTVALAQDGNPIFGKLVEVEWDGFCRVHTSGFIKFPGGLSATLTVGTKIVGALGASSAKGYIRSVAVPTGSYVQATTNDGLNGRGQIVDTSDTTNVVVLCY